MNKELQVGDVIQCPSIFEMNELSKEYEVKLVMGVQITGIRTKE